MYEVHGKVTFADERVENFSYAPSAYPYHIAADQAYIFNWADREFLLPGSGEYVFTAGLVAYDVNNGYAKLGTGSEVSIKYSYTKADESINWGPGLHETTVEAYDSSQIQALSIVVPIQFL